MAVHLYVKASEPVMQEVAGVSAEIASQVQTLNQIYKAACRKARNEGTWLGKQHEDPCYLAFCAYADAVNRLGYGADLYASLALGDGFSRFQGSHLVSNQTYGNERDPLLVAQLLEAQQQWVNDFREPANVDKRYSNAFIAALKRAEQAALRGDLSVSWS